MCVADAANWGNIELAGTNPTYRPLPHRCESHITSHSRTRLTVNSHEQSPPKTNDQVTMMDKDMQDQSSPKLINKITYENESEMYWVD